MVNEITVCHLCVEKPCPCLLNIRAQMAVVSDYEEDSAVVMAHITSICILFISVVLNNSLNPVQVNTEHTTGT